jgi:hypothetical protein
MAMIFRKRKENCGDCKFYVFGDGCHALPPENIKVTSEGSKAITISEIAWPQVKPNDWCGLFKKKLK